MAIQVYELQYWDGEEHVSDGVALVNTVTNTPLPVSRLAFRDTDDAEAFLVWYATRDLCDLREASAAYLCGVTDAWVGGDRDRWAGQVWAAQAADDECAGETVSP